MAQVNSKYLFKYHVKEICKSYGHSDPASQSPETIDTTITEISIKKSNFPNSDLIIENIFYDYDNLKLINYKNDSFVIITRKTFALSNFEYLRGVGVLDSDSICYNTIKSGEQGIITCEIKGIKTDSIVLLSYSLWNIDSFISNYEGIKKKAEEISDVNFTLQKLSDTIFNIITPDYTIKGYFYDPNHFNFDYQDIPYFGTKKTLGNGFVNGDSIGFTVYGYRNVLEYSAKKMKNNINNVTVHNKLLSIIYPNPFTNYIIVSLSKPPPVKSQLLIYDSHGTLVKKVDLVNSETKVNLTGIAKGNYLCKLMEGDKLLETKKLINVE